MTPAQPAPLTPPGRRRSPVRRPRARCLLAVELLEDRVTPSTYVVNRVDVDDDKVEGTLRYAITKANEDEVPDNITFELKPTEDRIVLGSALPLIRFDLSITGPGASRLTIEGG